MHATSRTIQPEATAALELFELVVSGPLRRVEAHPDGSWTVTPLTGQPLVLTGPAAVAAYVDQSRPQLAPAARPALPVAPAEPDPDEAGCGCVPVARAVPVTYEADMMQARAISAGLADFGVTSARRSVSYDDEHQAAAVRVATDHGIYALHIPALHKPFAVHRNGRRDGMIGARRVPGTADSLVSTLFAAYLRERGAL